ncbi:hypothetical protein WN51_02403 [Melipona quadrifasciata]|uniref:Uncharacterized protein n=1 Tax=Melipona quadrifasciata TaxID=166423 RepID=A0A0M8ZXD8_9HYME|nr:hypothetical protein WN51_02403 [Melipona quadrifasciata]
MPTQLIDVTRLTNTFERGSCLVIPRPTTALSLRENVFAQSVNLRQRKNPKASLSPVSRHSRNYEHFVPSFFLDSNTLVV